MNNTKCSVLAKLKSRSCQNCKALSSHYTGPCCQTEESDSVWSVKNQATEQVFKECNFVAQWALRQSVCVLWASTVLRQMEEPLSMPDSADEQTCHLTKQPASPLHSLTPPSSLLIACQLLPLCLFHSPPFPCLSSFYSLANLVTLELRENLLKSLPT